MTLSKIKIESFAKRCLMGALGGKGLSKTYCLVQKIKLIACISVISQFNLLTTWIIELNSLSNIYIHFKIVNGLNRSTFCRYLEKFMHQCILYLNAFVESIEIHLEHVYKYKKNNLVPSFGCNVSSRRK